MKRTLSKYERKHQQKQNNINIYIEFIKRASLIRAETFE